MTDDAGADHGRTLARAETGEIPLAGPPIAQRADRAEPPSTSRRPTPTQPFAPPSFAKPSPADLLPPAVPPPDLLDSSSSDAPMNTRSARISSGVRMVDRRLIVMREEHAAALVRLRTALSVAVPIWLGFGVMDWTITRFIEPGRLWYYLVLRGAGALAFGAVLLRLHRAPAPAPRVLRALDVGSYTLASVILTLLCLEFRGIESPYAAGITVVLVCHSLSIADRWHRNALLLGLPALAHPLTIGIARSFSPRLDAQLDDPRAVGTWLVYLSFILATYVFMLISGHVMWSLRRELLEMRSVGRYRLIRRIGKGGMGEVWAAFDDSLRHEVAIKILRAGAVSTSHDAARFEREVRATTELAHANTIRIFDYGTTEDGLKFYAMELLDGLDLFRLVEKDGPLEPLRAARIMRQAARALAEAHGRGIIHRDVTPGNLFVTSQGGERDFVKVLDFGIARVVDEAPSRSQTTGDLVRGTPSYIAPEVITGSLADARSDVYSMGTVLYFLLAGRAPFVGPQHAIVYAHVHTPPDAPAKWRGGPIPEALERIVLKCLAKSPDDRYAHAGELAAALGGIEGV